MRTLMRKFSIVGGLVAMSVMGIAAVVPLMTGNAQVQPGYPPSGYQQPGYQPMQPGYAPAQQVAPPQQRVSPAPAAAPQQPPAAVDAQPTQTAAQKQSERPPESVEVDVSTRSVAVTSSFTGTEIVVFGTVEHSRQPTAEAGYYDVAIILDGTPAPLIARRKAHVAGIWINTRSVRFEDVPSYYAIASTRPVEEIADVRVLDQHRIGFDSVHMTPAADQAQMTPEERDEFRRAVIRLKQKESLYQKSDYGVGFIGRSLFRSTISLPANVPVGPLFTHTYLFKDGKLLAKHSNRVILQREGVERFLHNFAFGYPLLYGVFAVFIAVASGLLASVMFKKGSH